MMTQIYNKINSTQVINKCAKLLEKNNNEQFKNSEQLGKILKDDRRSKTNILIGYDWKNRKTREIYYSSIITLIIIEILTI